MMRDSAGHIVQQPVRNVSQVAYGLALLVALAAPGSASAGFEPMNDEALSSVAAQDGLSIVIDDGAGGWSADAVKWTNDVGLPTQGGLSLDQLSLNTLGGNTFALDIDVGARGGVPVPRIAASWQELALEIGGISTYTAAAPNTPSTFSGGQFGFFSSGGLVIANENGLFNTLSTNAYFDLRFSDTANAGDFIMRSGGPGSPELSFGNANLRLQTTNCSTQDCTLALTNNGLVLAADTVNLDLNFDIMFKNAPTNFDRAGRSDMIKFGWSGGLADFDTRITPQGIFGAGVTLDTEFNYQSDFTLTLGQAGLGNARAEFKAYEPLGTQAGAVFKMPVTLDVVAAGSALQSLCFGNVAGCTPAANEESLVLPVDVQALGAQIRGGRLHAYNTAVDVVDPSADGNPADITPADIETYDWSLGFTFGHLDSNIMLYPGIDTNGDGIFDADGITSDILLTVSSPGDWQAVQTGGGVSAGGANWQDNTHFFIADTNTAVDVNGDSIAGDRYAFGLLNADLVWSADNLGIRIASDSDTALGVNFNGGLWLQSTDNVRYQFRGVLGGADLSDLSDVVPITLIDVRLDTDNFVFALSPANTDPASIGFEALLDLNSNAYVLLAEPSSPETQIGLNQFSGRVMWRNGKVQIRSSADNPDARPSLTIANDLQFGATASGGAPLRGTLQFDGANLANMAIPSGQAFFELSLKPQ